MPQKLNYNHCRFRDDFSEAAMSDNNEPLDAEELMLLGERISGLPAEDAVWVERIFHECLRSRMREAELLAAQVERGLATSSPDGGTVQLPDAQLAQVALDAAEWLKTLWNVGYMGSGSFPAQPRTAFPVVELEDVLKSSLFARIREGKRPLPFPPPTRNGLPWHDLVEGADAAHVVFAELVADSKGDAVGAIIEGCADWRVIVEVTKSSEYIVQHRGMGPLYQLSLNPFFSSLQRRPPQWGRQIRLHERAGVRSYALIWPNESGRAEHEIPLRAATWERAESEAAHWIATNRPEMYGQIHFERVTVE